VSDPGPEGEGPPGIDPAPEPTRARKKRRRKAGTVPQAPTRTNAASASEALALSGAAGLLHDDGVPAFARSFPRDPALSVLVDAFEAGDYARVRREAPELAQRTEDDAVRRAARELRRRLDPDPVAVYMLGAAVALLVLLAGWYWLHPHTP
jgi:hypothetical protein